MSTEHRTAETGGKDDEKKDHNHHILVWKECNALETKMRELLKRNNDPFCSEVEEIRSKLRQNYLYLLEEHASFCFTDKNVMDNLFKSVFYKQIEFVRKQLRNKYTEQSEQRSRLIHKLTTQIIPDAKSLYNDLLDQHLKNSLVSKTQKHCYTDDLLSSSNNNSNNNNKSKSSKKKKDWRHLNVESMRLSMDIAHKSLIYIGDLERYQENYSSNTNYDAAKLAYCLASQLMPTRGNPHNQLAVLNQAQINGDLPTIYRYILSLFVMEPFVLGKGNLSNAFKKTISIIDRTHDLTKLDQMVKMIETKSTWKEIQLYVIYVFAILYQMEYRLSSDYHHVLSTIQPAILRKISQILLTSSTHGQRNGSRNHAGSDTQAHHDDDHKDKQHADQDKRKQAGQAADKGDEEEEEDDDEEDQHVIDELGERDNNNITKQLCIISMFLVTETFDEENKYAGYKQAISWTLSLLSTMMKAVTSMYHANRNHSLALLKPITLCCLFLQNNLDFVVPNIEKPPWVKMQIDQSDLEPNNGFFTQLANLLNVLHGKFHKQDRSALEEQTNDSILPEETEFYGVKSLRVLDFGSDRYKYSSHPVFIYHRRFCSKLETLLKSKAQNKSQNKGNVYDYVRYLKLVQFARLCSEKIDGVLVFDENKWTAHNLQLTDDVTEAPEQPSQSGQNPVISQSPSPPAYQQLPPIPLQQKSQPDLFCSPMYHSTHRYPSHLHQQLHLNAPPHSGHYNNFPAHSHSHSHRRSQRHANINGSRSAPASPRGIGDPYAQAAQHITHRGNAPQQAAPPRTYLFNPPLMEDYPEDSEITIKPPFTVNVGIANGSSASYHDQIVKSTPTTPNRYDAPYNSGGNNSARQPPQPPLTSYLQHPHPPAFSYGHVSETHSENEPTTHLNGSKSSSYPHPPHGNASHSLQFRMSQEHQTPSNGKSQQHGPSTPPYGVPQTCPTPGDHSSFNFNSAYAAAAANTAYSGNPHNHHHMQPVTQPTTPVFGGHRSATSSASMQSYTPHMSHHHSLYGSNGNHHGHHGHHSSHEVTSPYMAPPAGSGHIPPVHHAMPAHTPNNSTILNIPVNEFSSPMFCEDIVSEVFEELHLSQQ
eukprot:CAMPEP_0197029878 /NCGR_PEP_ID=MMETSP1384-20130603/9234_1 /TAXON_ID=29189 /ORGANISM="Ammonia sp." /LENGTH=1096 /DNA_ID=CAMNT_0042459121 /DNA_START=28 /DNA_END=3318 /DNA_ORIENTATION=-